MTDQEKVGCAICLEPVTKQAVLTCCHQACHAHCVHERKKARHAISCPHYKQVFPITVFEVVHPQMWKKDANFVERVKNVWKDNGFWYCIVYNDFGSTAGFWGELKDPYEPNRTSISVTPIGK